MRRERPLRPINVITSPYPGFATDLQSPIMALSCLADGTSYIRENIYDGRFTLAGELTKMGAEVEVDGSVAIVHGPSALKGTKVIAHDLRTGIALILAGLGAEGETMVAPGYLIDRGHAAVASQADHPRRRHLRGGERLTWRAARRLDRRGPDRAWPCCCRYGPPGSYRPRLARLISRSVPASLLMRPPGRRSRRGAYGPSRRRLLASGTASGTEYGPAHDRAAAAPGGAHDRGGRAA